MANVSFRGNVGKVRGFTPAQNGGKSRFSFSVAEGHRKLNRQSNEWEDTGTTWFNVTVFGKSAEDLADVIAEGRKQQVIVTGRQESREYDANGQTRTSLDVIADNVGIVHRAPQGNNNSGFNTAPASNGGQGDVWGGSGQPDPTPNWGTPTGPENEPPF